MPSALISFWLVASLSVTVVLRSSWYAPIARVDSDTNCGCEPLLVIVSVNVSGVLSGATALSAPWLSSSVSPTGCGDW